jgi:hypothetical protein
VALNNLRPPSWLQHRRHVTGAWDKQSLVPQPGLVPSQVLAVGTGPSRGPQHQKIRQKSLQFYYLYAQKAFWSNQARQSRPQPGLAMWPFADTFVCQCRMASTYFPGQ